MFGFYRTMLAIWVMVFHLLDIPIIGPYAVYSFFVLSGFLMTTIMHESYGYDSGGLKRYAINRFLRLYPMYWAVAMASILVIIYVTPEYAALYNKTLHIPNSLESILFNTSMIFPNLFPNEVAPRLSPPTWALTIEIFYYVCIGLGISKSKRITLIWVSVSIIYYLFTYVSEIGGAHRYNSLLAGTLPFSLGSLMYFYKADVYAYLQKLKIGNPALLLSMFILNAAFFTLNAYYKPFTLHYYISESGRYLNIFITMLVIVSLFYRGKELFSKKIDKFIGDYSYPIYLLHWQLGLVASFILFITPTRGLSIDGLLVFIVSFVLVFITSSALIGLIDKNISIIRNNIKSKRITNNYATDTTA